MNRLVPLVIRPWMLPLIVAALAVPIVAGFALAGPPLGLGARRARGRRRCSWSRRARSYDEPIETAPAPDRRYRLLVVADEPVDDPASVERIAAIADEGRAVARPRPDAGAARRRPGAHVAARPLGLRPRRGARGRRPGARDLARRARRRRPRRERPGRRPRPGAGDHRRAATFPAREVVLVAGPGLGGARPRRSAAGSTGRSALLAISRSARPARRSRRPCAPRRAARAPRATPARSSARRPGSATSPIARVRSRTLGL